MRRRADPVVIGGTHITLEGRIAAVEQELEIAELARTEVNRRPVARLLADFGRPIVRDEEIDQLRTVRWDEVIQSNLRKNWRDPGRIDRISRRRNSNRVGTPSIEGTVHPSNGGVQRFACPADGSSSGTGSRQVGVYSKISRVWMWSTSGRVVNESRARSRRWSESRTATWTRKSSPPAT